MRLQASGIIKSYDFDSIILGTSILENTSAKEASQYIGGKFFNISINGSSYYERAFLLSKSLAKGLKYVIYSLDDAYFQCWKDNPHIASKYWNFLYDDNEINNIKIYFQKKYLLHPFSKFNGIHKSNLDAPKAWCSKYTSKRNFGGLEKWIKNVDNNETIKFIKQDLPQIITQRHVDIYSCVLDSERLSKAKSYIDTYIMQYIKQYPQTKFFLLFPPYSRAKYTTMMYLHPQDYLLHQATIRHLATLASSTPNMRVFGFEDQDFLDDITNYKDLVHYHAEYNSYFLESFAKGLHELTSDNVDAYLIRCAKKAKDFDYVKLNELAQSLIKNK